MPGFNVGNIGGGYSTAGPANTLEVRRKHRWVFESLGAGGGALAAAELLVLSSASRPSFKLEEPEMHHNQEVIYFAGKQTWEPVTLTWYDSEQAPNISATCYAWLNTVVNLRNLGVSTPSFYKRTASLVMLNGVGAATERWVMYGTWPTSVNWQELSYDSTDLLTIEATMRYDRALKDL
jgi:hypothetical protein